MYSRKSRKSKYNCCKKNNFYNLIDFLFINYIETLL